MLAPKLKSSQFLTIGQYRLWLDLCLDNFGNAVRNWSRLICTRRPRQLCVWHSPLTFCLLLSFSFICLLFHRLFSL
ncbi:hypothetical protein K504DRAFT_179305 [Pleomassaria siparia CBS 279.74]|uniref:Uncharacterized protein n=1 Tax=Pleomassaria siparia CBS 279.74 TaxID=1314801 RepID=A0A6G1JSA8_9PLEO|nr:hypothetical protein K504DRAFT_179305 [Pleomassaria siparia CBS 279.74]